MQNVTHTTALNKIELRLIEVIKHRARLGLIDMGEARRYVMNRIECLTESDWKRIEAELMREKQAV